MKKVEACLLEKKSEAFSAMPGNYFYILTEMWWTNLGNNPFSTICFKAERLWAIWLHSSHNGLIAPYQLKYIPTILKFIPSKGHMPLKQLMPTPLMTNPPEASSLTQWRLQLAKGSGPNWTNTCFHQHVHHQHEISCECLVQMDDCAKKIGTHSVQMDDGYVFLVYRWHLYRCRMMQTPQNWRPWRVTELKVAGWVEPWYSQFKG